MKQSISGTRASRRRQRRKAVALLLAAGGAAMVTGCGADSWFDPSVTGYWEDTPTIMPILDRIAAIEEQTPDMIETSPPVREDLIAQGQAYRLGPSDEIQITIPNFEQGGFVSQYPRSVDQRGYVTLPRIGQVYVTGMTDVEAQNAIARAIVDADILRNPEVSVIIVAPRQLTFNALGGVRSPGVYIVLKPDYRLLDAMAAAGGFDETVEKIYVIRQIPLSDEATGRTAPPPSGPSTRPQTAPPVDPQTLIKQLEDLLEPENKPVENPAPGSPSVVSTNVSTPASGARRATYTGLQPDQQPATPSAPPSEPRPTPPIDLIDSTESPTPRGNPVPVRPETATDANASRTQYPARPRSRWVFVNGQWTRDVVAASAPSPSDAPDPLANVSPGKDLLTQRVIEVPAKELLAGKSDVNIVIRPGDVIRVPVAPSGIVYVAGQVSRPGTFGLPVNGTLTLKRAIDAAGGLSQLGIPERVDLTRMVGSNREATIRLNFRAISENTQPDVVLKPDDRINVGTNFWAFPIAILRNGLRFSYGFGFLVDRNFGNDIFGAPPGSFE